MSKARMNKHEPDPQECPLCKGDGSAAPIMDETLGVLTPIPRGLIKNEAEYLEALVPYYKNLPPKEYVRVTDISEEVNESVPKNEGK